MARMWESRVAYWVLVGKPEGRRTLERSKRRWENNIQMDLEEVVWGGMDWNHVAQNRDEWRAVVNAVLSIRIPSNAGNFSIAALLASQEVICSMQLMYCVSCSRFT